MPLIVGGAQCYQEMGMEIPVPESRKWARQDRSGLAAAVLAFGSAGGEQGDDSEFSV